MGITAREFLESQKKILDLFDAQVLLAHIIGVTRPQLVTRLDTVLTSLQLDSAQQTFSRLVAGEPLPYILGHWEFFGLDFDVTKDVLIPRPETELLVEKAIEYLKKYPKRRTVADIGTGSGAIALSIAKNIQDSHILATDISPKALQVARRNAIKHGVDSRVKFIECDLFPNKSSTHILKSKIDLFCANLPYIPTFTLQTLPIYGQEPTIALDGGDDGLDIYRKLFDIIPQWIAPSGTILMEIEAGQGISASNLASRKFIDATMNLYKDLAGRDRLLEIQVKS